MNRKISLGICISLIIISVTATFALTMVVSKRIFSKIISDISRRSQTYASVDEIDKIVSNYYYGSVDDASRLNASLAKGYVNGLGDGANIYLDSAEYAAYSDKLESGATGAGIETAFDFKTGKFVVVYVYAGSPAEKAGLKAMDVVTAVNDRIADVGNYSALREEFYGNGLSSVKIEYERDGETKTVEPMLGFPIPSVKSRLIGDVGYIKLTGFYKNTAAEFKAAADKLIKDGAESMIFDVRNASDGLIDYAAQTIDVVVPAVSDNIAVARDKNGNIYKEKVYAAENSSVTKPFVVLINNYTSGPAELFACDLRDISNARLVGERTAGEGYMRELFPLENGGAVLLAVALIEPKGGEEAVYQGVGVEPTVEVALATGDPLNLDLLDDSQDNQLAEALSMLSASN